MSDSAAAESKTTPTPEDAKLMQRCLTLARTARGRTAPNPMVGALVVKDGTIVGEGYHPGAGNPHAEVFALSQAGELARGAIVYVTLEPCNHYGRTPPCTEALIAAGVAKVVVGTIDPNPLVAGKGVERLRSAGIEVVVGVEMAACQQAIEGFAYRMLHSQPFGILKYAMTLDGKIATTTGESKWISSPEARSFVHDLRSGCEAVIIGGNTLRRDDPLLTSHHPDAANPLRVVMTRSRELPLDARLWDVTTAPTLIAATEALSPECANNLGRRGVEVLILDELTPQAVMQLLYDRGMMSVLWECGGTLAASAIHGGCVQKIVAAIAPKIVGGNAPSPIGDLGISAISAALVLQDIAWETIGSDLLISGYLKTPD